MPRVRSAKGKIIDFDLLKIKRQMAGKPISIDVKARQQFIDDKARRRIRKATAAVAAKKVGDQILAAIQPTEAAAKIDAKSAQIVDVTKTEIREDKQTKQKVRPPTKE